MKILWLINTITPDICRDLDIQVRNDGGWISGLSKSLSVTKGYELIICFPYHKYVNGTCDNISYSSFVANNFYRYNKALEDQFESILKKEKPDVIHIFGTEYPHTLAMVNASKQYGLLDKTIISIQGLVSVYANHYFAGLPYKIIHSYTIHDFLKHDNLYWQAQKFKKLGQCEIEALKKVKHVIGRTDWDKACVKLINNDIQYHFCNETLRDAFYFETWNYNQCEKHSIFLGSCSYPIKGFHCFIKIFPKVLEKFPDAKIYVPGDSPLKQNGFKTLLHKTAYQVYLKKIIVKNHLENKIVFLGGLSGEEMKKQMLKSNVFILPSSIENSPNTLGEAMLLGVPCIASDVGGVKNMALDKKEILIYPFDEPYMMSLYIDKIFNDRDYTNSLSYATRKRALVNHDKEENNKTLIEIYKELNK